jgi:CubicO group peptidase (beta-lactamase class C family)
MKKRINVFNAVIFLTVLIVLISCSKQQTNSHDERIKNVENGLVEYNYNAGIAVEQLIDSKRTDSLPKMNIVERMKTFNIPGVSIAVIDNYKLVWAKGYGVMEAGTDKLVTTETMFQSGSTTKVLMGITILRLVDEGKLNLDVDVNTYLKTWKMPEHPSGIKVTLRMLLTHQAGINRPGNGTECEPGTEPTLLQFLKGEKPVLSDSVFYENVPGTTHSYSNFGYMIMQYMLEDYFKTSYTEIIKQYVFKPLKMNSSIIEYPFPKEFAERVIRPHSAKGVPSKIDDLNSAPLAQAGLISTPTDLAKLARELMLTYQGKSKKILSQKAVKDMFTCQRKLNPREFEGLNGQGIGVFLFGQDENEFFMHHGHNNPGANCLFVGSINKGKGVVIMTNGMYGLILAAEIMSSVAKEYNWDEATK